VALLVVAPIAGAVFFGAIFVATATLAFWWIESGEASAIVTYGGRDFTGYPTSIFGGWFRRVFAYALGMAFVAYYPALALLGVPDPLGLPAWAGWAAPAVAPVAAMAAGLVWRTGVRHYRSTGS
jgi:ABC-2 type transport system permease protein